MKNEMNDIEERVISEETQMTSNFRSQLIHILNNNSRENGSDTPDYILADYMVDCLAAFDKTLQAREKWYGREVGSWKLNAKLSRQGGG